jgi:hypothetical protein
VIASYSTNFIFLKTRKTGGTSAEIVLSTWCSGRDICTPITVEDEKLRSAYGGAAMNYSGHKLPCTNHMPASDVREVVPDLWATAFKFAVDRHPYEKVISRAWWNIGRRRGNPDNELKEEIDLAIETKSYVNFPIYTIGGKVAVNELVRYEEMWPRIERLAHSIGRVLPNLPNAKGAYRADRRPAKDVLTLPQRRKIMQDASIEFELLDYEP